jgi:predicted phage-related endonuclease
MSNGAAYTKVRTDLVRSRAAGIKRRVKIYESPNIIEARHANEILGHPPFCKRFFYYSKKHKSPMKPILADQVRELLEALAIQCYHPQNDNKIRRPMTVLFHKTMPFMASFPDRTEASEKNATSERLWKPIVIDIVNESAFRILDHDGITDRHINIVQHHLAVKRRSVSGIYLAFCPETLGLFVANILRDPQRVKELEEAAYSMYQHLEREYPPDRTLGNCDACKYHRMCIDPATAGEYDKSLEKLSGEWLRAEYLLQEAERAKKVIENAIKYEMDKKEEAHTESANFSYKTINRWKLDAELLMKEHPDVGRIYKRTITERILKVKR